MARSKSAGTAPAERKFQWYGGRCGMSVYGVLAGVRHDRLYADFDAIVEAYTRGKPRAIELFGPDVAQEGPCWAPISYGHVNALGAKLVFPEDSEVAFTPIYGSLEEGIRALKKERDLGKEGMFPFYVSLWERLKKAFPSEKIPFWALKAEGPLTTGWALRGHDFFADVLEYPAQAAEYLRLVTESIIRYKKMMRRINGLPEIVADDFSVADDVAAMFAPDRWPEIVLPPLELYYQAQTTGKRAAHIENLSIAHLKYLNELRILWYDSSVSPRLTPELVRGNYAGEFGWLFTSMACRELSPEGIRRWVFEAAMDANLIRAALGRETCAPEMVKNLHRFIAVAKEVAALLAGGLPREKLMDRV